MSEIVESVDTCWNDYASMRKGISKIYAKGYL